MRPHQASDIAKLWQEVLSVLELIACIGCAVSKSNKSSVAEAMRTLRVAVATATIFAHNAFMIFCSLL